MPSVTVVIPVLNDREMLKHCLGAICAQTRLPDSLVVVDNGSVDDSAMIAERAGAVVVREPRRGILAATARGFDSASGEILARIDADSRPEPDWLARVMGHFESDPQLAAVTGTGHFYGSRPRSHTLGQRLYLGGYFFWLGLLLGHPPLYGSNFAIRADIWHAIRHGLHQDLAGVHDDLDISFQLRSGMRVHFDPELIMPVSDRPFASFGQIARRVRWGFQTIWINGRDQNLLRRRAAVVAERQQRPDGEM